MAKKHCYDKWWLSKDMENMGYIFEYCEDYCHDLFNINISPESFIKEFMNSVCRREMETGHLKLLSQSALDTVEDFVTLELKQDYSKFIQIGGYCYTSYTVTS